MAQSLLQTGLRDCPDCGRKYFNWCVYCMAQQEVESVPQLMEKWGLSTDNLIQELAYHVSQNSFPAVSLALSLRGIGVTKRVEFEGKLDITGRTAQLTDEEVDERIKELERKEAVTLLE